LPFINRNSSSNTLANGFGNEKLPKKPISIPPAPENNESIFFKFIYRKINITNIKKYYEALAANVGDFGGQDVYKYEPDANNTCLYNLQKCSLSSAHNFDCVPASIPPANSTPLQLNKCVEKQSTILVTENTDLTAWKAAVAAGTIQTNQLYSVHNGQVQVVTEAVAQKLECPKNADATGIVVNPSVSRQSGWTNGANKAPLSSPASVVSCSNGWQGQLFAKYERRSCQQTKLTSTQGTVTTAPAVPETVFKLYYVGAFCQAAAPVSQIVSCPASVANSNPSGQFTLSRQLGMSQPVHLAWQTSKNTSQSKLSGQGWAVPEDLGYTKLTQAVNYGNFSRSLGRALQSVGALNQQISCFVGSACDTTINNPNVSRVAYNYANTGAAPTACPSIPGIRDMFVGNAPNGSSPDPIDPQNINGSPFCFMGGQCGNGGQLPSCRPDCLGGGAPDANGKCQVARVCPNGTPPDAAGKCFVAATCPNGSPPDGAGKCAADPNTNTTAEVTCPAGTTIQTVGGIVTGCTAAPICTAECLAPKVKNAQGVCGPCPSGTAYSNGQCVPLPLQGSVAILTANNIIATQSVTLKTCDNPTDPTRATCYALLDDGQNARFCSGSCDLDIINPPVEITGSVENVAVQLNQAPYMPPGLAITYANFVADSPSSLYNAMANNPASWVLLFANNFYENNSCSPQIDLAGCYLAPNSKQYCKLYNPVSQADRAKGCYIDSIGQDRAYQYGGGAEVRFYATGSTGANVSTPAVSEKDLTSSAIFNKLVEAMRRAMR
jgi:hypothetical protein